MEIGIPGDDCADSIGLGFVSASFDVSSVFGESKDLPSVVSFSIFTFDI